MDRPRLGIYRHFKGNYYRLLLVAEHSESREPLAIYQALYGERGYWARPLIMWNETVKLGGADVTRFAFVCETEEELARFQQT
jgi:hypothetical protein